MIRLILPGKHCVCKHILPPFLMKMLFIRNDQLCIYATNAGSRTIPIQDRAEYTARQPRSVRYAQIDISISHYTEPAKLLTRCDLDTSNLANLIHGAWKEGEISFPTAINDSLSKKWNISPSHAC